MTDIIGGTMEVGGAAVCTAYATEENARTSASRFVGPVQLRGARGRVWLYGRRVPTWWLVAHSGGRGAGLLVVAWVATLAWWGDWWPLGWPTIGKKDEIGDLWRTYKTRRETVSWPAVHGKIVSEVAIAGPRYSRSEKVLPGKFLARGVSAKAAQEAFERSRAGYGRLLLEVPLGRKARMTALHLEVAAAQREQILAVLRGTAGAVPA
jgi:hypothetical protein